MSHNVKALCMTLLALSVSYALGGSLAFGIVGGFLLFINLLPE